MEKLIAETTNRAQQAAENFLILLCGGVLYYGLEVLWRGWSHFSMAVCGALCFLLLYRMNAKLHAWAFPIRAAAGAVIITAVELIAGCVLNLLLGWNIWDYSDKPMQFLGQICLPASLLWFLLCIPAGWLCAFLRRVVFLRAS